MNPQAVAAPQGSEVIGLLSVWEDFSAQKVVQARGDEWEKEEFSG